MFKSNQILKITADSSTTTDVLELRYSILDIDIADRWAALIDKNNALSHSIRYNYRKILSKDDIQDRFKKFQDNINFINAHYDRKLTDIVSVDFLKENQHILNDLHEEFEIYGDRLEKLIQIGYFSNPLKFPEYFNPIWPGSLHENDKEVHEAFLLLNEQIHNFEAVYRNWGNQNRALCTCLWDFMPAGLHEDLLPEDYLLFAAEHMWGYAYLGYNTLGKHWNSSCHDNDVEVVKRLQIRPQQRFAAETYLNFSLHSPNYSAQINLYNWWRKNNFSEIIDTENLKLKDLALGYIPVGKLYQYTINDGTPMPIDNSTNKAHWNQTVWSKFDRIKQVEVVHHD
jgi:hypothetical protein